MDVRTHEDLTDASLEGAWRALAEADPSASIFQGPAWLRAWATSRAPGPVQVRVVSDGPTPVAAFAEVDLGEGCRTVPGGTDVTDYRGPVGLPEHRRAAATAWLAALADDGVVEMALHGIATDAGWLDVLDEVAGPAGWVLQDREREDVCPRVRLPEGDPEGWLEALDAKERHELRRKGRKLARDLGGMEVVEADDLEAALDRFWTMAVTADGDKGAFFRDDDMRAFFWSAIEALAADGVVRVHELLVGDLPAASMISVIDQPHREWGLYNSALDETLAAFAPGTVLASELCTLAASEGFLIFDFLRGDEAYKYRFGAVDRAIERATLRRVG